MTDGQLKAAMLELLEQWDKNRKRWIEKHNTEIGFSKWFTGQVEKIGRGEIT